MARFEEEYPSLDSYWRSIILFGQNVASYKFALGRSILDFAAEGKTEIPLQDLAVPFSENIASHLSIVDKQATSASSQFLDSCRQYNKGEIDRDSLTSQTVRIGFNNVIDAFHVVNGQESPVRFFQDARKGTTPKIVLTDDLLVLARQSHATNLPWEIEARWRLVENAWSLNISRNLIAVAYDDADGNVYTEDRNARRVSLGSCRSAISGYQKGRCFHCFGPIQIEGDDAAEVDHFFPHILTGRVANLNGVWNLVLACRPCNRAKSARVPARELIERLHTRNEFYIESLHPLRQTIIAQTGSAEAKRIQFLQDAYRDATAVLIHAWQPEHVHPRAF